MNALWQTTCGKNKRDNDAHCANPKAFHQIKMAIYKKRTINRTQKIWHYEIVKTPHTKHQKRHKVKKRTKPKRIIKRVDFIAFDCAIDANRNHYRQGNTYKRSAKNRHNRRANARKYAKFAVFSTCIKCEIKISTQKHKARKYQKSAENSNNSRDFVLLFALCNK